MAECPDSAVFPVLPIAVLQLVLNIPWVDTIRLKSADRVLPGCCWPANENYPPPPCLALIRQATPDTCCIQLHNVIKNN